MRLYCEDGRLAAGQPHFFMKWLITSMGSGKMMVEFFSAAMVVSVCR